MTASHHRRTFKMNLYVPYAHIDKMGFVYYANYLVYFEMARADMMRQVGTPYGELEKKGVMLPVIEAHCVYKKPAHYDDHLEVNTVVTDIKGVRIRMEYVIKRGDDTLVTGYTEHVCLSPEGKVLKPVPEIRQLTEG